MRGPDLFSQRPQKKEEMPSTKMLIVKVNVTCEIVH